MALSISPLFDPPEARSNLFRTPFVPTPPEGHGAQGVSKAPPLGGGSGATRSLPLQASMASTRLLTRPGRRGIRRAAHKIAAIGSHAAERLSAISRTERSARNDGPFNALSPQSNKYVNERRLPHCSHGGAGREGPSKVKDEREAIAAGGGRAIGRRKTPVFRRAMATRRSRDRRPPDDSWIASP